MPYPNTSVLNIIIPQTSASIDPTSTQAPFVERIISGSRLILQTDTTGTLIGSSDLNVNSITASNISASGYISASNLYVRTNITDAGTLTVVGATTLAGLTGTTATFSGMVSASAGLTASAIQDAGTLTVVGATTLAGLTGTTATFSGLVSASAGLTASAIQDAGTLTVVGNSILSTVFATNVTASNISASGQIIASSFTGSLLGTSSWANVSLSSSVDKINDNSTYYVTFVNNTGSSALKADADILSYNPLLNRVIIGNTSGSLFISNDSGTNPNSIALFNSNDNQGSIIQIGSPSTNATASLYVGNQSNGFRVLTGQGNNTGVVTELTTKITNATNATSYVSTTAALQVDGGARISKDTWISGSLNVAGDLTIFGSSSIVYISSSTVIINDNIIQLNAFFPFERYAGFEVFDSGSNQRSASLLWDGQNDNWMTVDQNNSASNIIHGPTASFGTNPGSLTANNIPKAYDATGITTSSLSDDGTTLRYTGNVISASSITASNGTITNVSGTLITYVTGSFTALTVVTGSAPLTGSQVPTSPTAAGMPGQIEVDNNFIYVYTNNIWKRVPLSTWSL